MTRDHGILGMYVQPQPTSVQSAADLAQKPYLAAIEDVLAATAAVRADFDHKILAMMDALHDLGHAEAACRHLKEVLANVSRSHVVHWRRYIFKLLRDFDYEAYRVVKAKLAAGYAEHLPWIEEPSDRQHLRSAAPDFVPGSLGWMGEVRPTDFAKVASHRLHAGAPAFDSGSLGWLGEVKPSDFDKVAAHPLHAEAPAFDSGSLCWVGNVKAADLAKVAAHPLHAEAPTFRPGMQAWGADSIAEVKSEA